MIYKLLKVINGDLESDHVISIDCGGDGHLGVVTWADKTGLVHYDSEQDIIIKVLINNEWQSL